MQVSQVSNEDGIQMAHVVKALGVARFDNITGSDAEKLTAAKRWLAGIAQQMAAQLGDVNKAKPATAAAPATGGFKVKAMGSLPTSGRNRKKK